MSDKQKQILTTLIDKEIAHLESLLNRTRQNESYMSWLKEIQELNLIKKELNK